jgi:hypothetical protein
LKKYNSQLRHNLQRKTVLKSFSYSLSIIHLQYDWHKPTMTKSALIHLFPRHFGESEQTFIEHGDLSATTFTYSTGVVALRLRNDKGNLIMLPFQGQQIWSAEFGGRILTMKSMFREPRPTQNYLETYGGFLLHCGATAMGVPGPEDTHALHGELPNAPYQAAYVVLGSDARGDYIGLSGEYQHIVAFNHNYLAQPLVKLYAGESCCTIELTVTNLKRTPMEFMYLAHVNFRPVDNSELVYSAPSTPEHVRVRQSIPSHVSPGPGYAEFLQELTQHPDRHHILKPDLAFDPEIVLNIDYLADADGWAHSLQVHPNGSADYICHRPEQLDTGVRWICRTADQDALGIILPATAEPEGYIAEKAKGNIKTIAAGGSFTCRMEAGALSIAETDARRAHIAQILAQA